MDVNYIQAIDLLLAKYASLYFTQNLSWVILKKFIIAINQPFFFFGKLQYLTSSSVRRQAEVLRGVTLASSFFQHRKSRQS